MAASEKVVRMIDKCRDLRSMDTNGSTLSVHDATHTLAHHESLHNAPEKPYTTFTLAYDRLQSYRLLEALQSGSVELIHNALTSTVSGVLGSTTETFSFRAQEASGVIEACAELSVNGPTQNIQRLSLRVLQQVLRHPSAGRADLLLVSNGVVASALRQAVDSSDAQLRRVAYDSLAFVAETAAGATACLQLGFCRHLVSRVHLELPLYSQGGAHRLPLDAALRALLRLASHSHTNAVSEAIASHAVPYLLEVLRVRECTRDTLCAACGCLARLATTEAGQGAVMAEESRTGAIKELMMWAKCDDAGVVSAAIAVLTGALIEDDSKRAVLDIEDGCSALIAALDLHPSNDTSTPTCRVPHARKNGARHVVGSRAEILSARLNACTALATLAAHPRARSDLASAPLSAPAHLSAVIAEMELITSGREDPMEKEEDKDRLVAALIVQLATAASRALGTITWTP